MSFLLPAIQPISFYFAILNVASFLSSWLLKLIAFPPRKAIPEPRPQVPKERLNLLDT